MFGNRDPLEQKLRESGGKTAPALINTAKPGKVVKGSDDPANGGVAEVLWKLTLRVFPEGGSPFNANLKVPYPQKAGGPPVGTKVGVLYDPRDHSKIVIDENAPTESFGSVQATTMAGIVSQSAGASGLVIAGGQVLSPSAAAPAAPAEPASVADQLAKLAELKNQGALTEAEFEAQKQKLLGT